MIAHIESLLESVQECVECLLASFEAAHWSINRHRANEGVKEYFDFVGIFSGNSISYTVSTSMVSYVLVR